ncbi:hypothetical protein IQ210_40960 [Streptomyces sp. 3R004]|nr:hypothetical protein [Streptomyces justiciae]
MRLSLHTVVPRVWTVELRPRAGGPLLVCPRCAPRAVSLQASAAKSDALRHLAAHARGDALAGHLRTCQCRQRECRWHPRHRGCAGPIRLVLARDRAGRNWRLADACTACARAIPYAAVVPDTATDMAVPGEGDGCVRPQRAATSPGLPSATRVREMLAYLAAALPACTSAAARLVALQCALRVDGEGSVTLADGITRSMRLGHLHVIWHELEQAAWLRSDPSAQRFRRFDLLDPSVLTQVPGRRARAQAADWALRQTCRPAVRRQRAVARLVALQIAACTDDHGRGSIETIHLTRTAGISSVAAATLLDQLARVGALDRWQLDPATDEVRWTSRPC